MNKRKPPLGVMPRKLWKDDRLRELNRAISERIGTVWDIPTEWVVERNQILKDFGEKDENNEGCDYCTSEQINDTVAYIPSTHQNQDDIEVVFRCCPMCGRKLAEE